DLVLRIKAWVSLLIHSWHRQCAFRRECRTPFSAYLESRRDEDPPAHGLGCELDESGPQGQRQWGVHSTAGRGGSKFIDDNVAGFIDDHVAGADKPGGVADRRDCARKRSTNPGPHVLFP